jgi:hypothetical protein
MAVKYFKWPKYVPNGQNMFQMAKEYTNLKALQFLSQIEIFGLKIDHLATLT